VHSVRTQNGIHILRQGVIPTFCRDYERIGEMQSGDEEGGSVDIKSKIKQVRLFPCEVIRLLMPVTQAKVALKRASQEDLYKFLGLTRGADEDEIRKAYRKMALKLVNSVCWVVLVLFTEYLARHHPDKQAGKSDEEKAQAEAQFKAIGRAYEVLSDPEKKQRYDEGNHHRAG
jgi:preprotein translocase subunit Sec63